MKRMIFTLALTLLFSLLAPVSRAEPGWQVSGNGFTQGMAPRRPPYRLGERGSGTRVFVRIRGGRYHLPARYL